MRNKEMNRDELLAEMEVLRLRIAELEAQVAKADEAGRETENRYRSLVETSPDPIVTHDLKGNLITVNQQAAIAYGVDSPEQLMAEVKNVSDILDEDSRERAAANLQRILSTGASRKNK